MFKTDSASFVCMRGLNGPCQYSMLEDMEFVALFFGRGDSDERFQSIHPTFEAAFEAAKKLRPRQFWFAGGQVVTRFEDHESLIELLLLHTSYDASRLAKMLGIQLSVGGLSDFEGFSSSHSYEIDESWEEENETGFCCQINILRKACSDKGRSLQDTIIAAGELGKQVAYVSYGERRLAVDSMRPSVILTVVEEIVTKKQFTKAVKGLKL